MAVSALAPTEIRRKIKEMLDARMSGRIDDLLSHFASDLLFRCARVFPLLIESRGFPNRARSDSNSVLEEEASTDGASLFS